MKSKCFYNLSIGLVLAYAALVLAGLGGWIANLVKLVAMIGDGGVTTMFIARIVGIPAAPLGAILGYF